jgi:hypothetical protein
VDLTLCGLKVFQRYALCYTRRPTSPPPTLSASRRVPAALVLCRLASPGSLLRASCNVQSANLQSIKLHTIQLFLLQQTFQLHPNFWLSAFGSIIVTRFIALAQITLSALCSRSRLRLRTFATQPGTQPNPTCLYSFFFSFSFDFERLCPGVTFPSR